MTNTAKELRVMVTNIELRVAGTDKELGMMVASVELRLTDTEMGLRLQGWLGPRGARR